MFGESTQVKFYKRVSPNFRHYFIMINLSWSVLVTKTPKSFPQVEGIGRVGSGIFEVTHNTKDFKGYMAFFIQCI